MRNKPATTGTARSTLTAVESRGRDQAIEMKPAWGEMTGLGQNRPGSSRGASSTYGSSSPCSEAEPVAPHRPPLITIAPGRASGLRGGRFPARVPSRRIRQVGGAPDVETGDRAPPMLDYPEQVILRDRRPADRRGARSGRRHAMTTTACGSVAGGHHNAARTYTQGRRRI
jgi:hypothetical protein